MSERFEAYRSGRDVPRETWTWNMYGAGVERIGRDGKPERFPVPAPGPDQLLCRVDAVGMCFSDTKLVKQGGKHPKLYDRDLEHEPTVLGHEVALTVMKVGERLAGKYHAGQRLGLQPDIYDQAGRSTAFGYTIRGGLTQYLLLGPEVLDVNGECFVLPIEGEMGYAETALTEPWACVEGAYTQRRRLEPLAGGAMWIVGQPGDATPYRCSARLSAPGTFVLTDVRAGLADQVRAEAARRGAQVIVKDGLRPADPIAGGAGPSQGPEVDRVGADELCSAGPVAGEGDGQDMPDEIAEDAEQYLTAAKHKAVDIINEGKKKSEILISDAHQKAQSLLDDAEKILTDAREKAGVVVEEGARIKSAVKAGIDAFKDERSRS